LRDPALVVADVEQGLTSADVARDIYKVEFDDQTLLVDEAATDAVRTQERQARIDRGIPYDEFVQQWTTAEPPEGIPYFGSWDDKSLIYGHDMGQRVTMAADEMRGMFQLDPKDLRIAELEAELGERRSVK
jgi:hypothetical protein